MELSPCFEFQFLGFVRVVELLNDAPCQRRRNGRRLGGLQGRVVEAASVDEHVRVVGPERAIHSFRGGRRQASQESDNSLNLFIRSVSFLVRALWHLRVHISDGRVVE
jgi:hypothetical protein